MNAQELMEQHHYTLKPKIIRKSKRIHTLKRVEQDRVEGEFIQLKSALKFPNKSPDEKEEKEEKE